MNNQGNDGPPEKFGSSSAAGGAEGTTPLSEGYPGTPAPAMSGEAGGPAGETGPAAFAPPPAVSSTRRRRWPAVLIALGVLLAGGGGAGISYALAGSSTAITTTSQGRTPSNSPSGGVTDPYGSGAVGPFDGGPFGDGNASSGSASSTPVAGSGAPSDISAIAAKASPAVVDINSTFNYQSATGAGTGIVLTSNGEVLTNNHVVNGATKITVTDVGNGKTYDASVVGYDETTDLAVLQLQGASGLKTATIGNSSTAAVGEPIVAIGNAGGSGGTPTSAGGSVTGINQSVTASDSLNGSTEQLTGLIGVNADVQPGDSGGPLVNSAGQVLGIDTAGSSGSSFQFTGSSSTQAFAIPINGAMSVVSQIESGHGTSTIHVGATAFLGVLTSSSVQQNGGPFGGANSSSSSSGVTIASVVSGGAAANAGLAAGDVITSFDGEAVSSSSALSELLVPLHPGDKAQISWTDATGQSHTATVDLGSGPPA